MLTPSAPSTSAAPERDDKARLPCLAIVIPHPAVTSAAPVDIFSVPPPSPPVPTISIESFGAEILLAFNLIIWAAAVISSTVSPLTRKAIRNAPI